ncbi:MAG: hypothetical protein DRN78_02205 [Thermoproteota archaeon]|nr:MAG: hypothetical protein DRN78_02205 [Candidatus Korarchaeota archaeon]
MIEGWGMSLNPRSRVKKVIVSIPSSAYVMELRDGDLVEVKPRRESNERKDYVMNEGKVIALMYVLRKEDRSGEMWCKVKKGASVRIGDEEIRDLEEIKLPDDRISKEARALASEYEYSPEFAELLVRFRKEHERKGKNRGKEKRKERKSDANVMTIPAMIQIVDGIPIAIPDPKGKFAISGPSDELTYVMEKAILECLRKGYYMNAKLFADMIGIEINETSLKIMMTDIRMREGIMEEIRNG